MRSKIYLAVYLLLLSLSLSSQQAYYPFPDSNTVWSVDNLKYLMKGDSIYNSLTYKKYYMTNDTSLSASSLQYICMVRQNIPNKKVYVIPKNQSAERLLYRFDLNNINDTVTVYSFATSWAIGSNKVQLISKDSILINGSYRKRLGMKLYSSSWGVSYWIEGIGSLLGPFDSGLIFGSMTDICYPTLLCEKEQGITNYINPQYNKCYFNPCSTGLTMNYYTHGISIYPNPANTFINVEFKTLMPGAVIKLTDVLGKDIEGHIYVSNGINQRINVKNLEKGIYFLQIVANGRSVASEKIVIE